MFNWNSPQIKKKLGKENYKMHMPDIELEMTMELVL